MIRTKRVYDIPEESDGFRILVDRLWPRGLTKERAKVDLWLKEIAPSDALRKGFCHDVQKWPEFKKQYFEELENRQQLVNLIADKARNGTVTLVYGAKEERFNNAVALKEYLES